MPAIWFGWIRDRTIPIRHKEGREIFEQTYSERFEIGLLFRPYLEEGLDFLMPSQRPKAHDLLLGKKLFSKGGPIVIDTMDFDIDTDGIVAHADQDTIAAMGQVELYIRGGVQAFWFGAIRG